MEKITYSAYCGIDVSKGWLDIAIDGQVYKIDQEQQIIETFIQDHLLSKPSLLCVLESTGGHEHLVCQCLAAAGIDVHIAHPNKVVAFARAKGRLAKTDPIDARLLSEYGGFITQEELRAPLSQEQLELQSLSARLTQLKSQHHQEACRLGTAVSPVVKESVEDMMKTLEEAIKIIEKHLLKLIRQDASLQANYNILISMPGVGPTLAMKLLTDLPELGQINKKQVAALVGVAPIPQQSGQRQGNSAVAHGRGDIRKILYMAALVASCWNSQLKEFYQRLVKAGKPKKVVLVAVMRKMLVTLNAMVMKKEMYKTQ